MNGSPPTAAPARTGEWRLLASASLVRPLTSMVSQEINQHREQRGRHDVRTDRKLEVKTWFRLHLRAEPQSDRHDSGQQRKEPAQQPFRQKMRELDAPADGDRAADRKVDARTPDDIVVERVRRQVDDRSRKDERKADELRDDLRIVEDQ